MDFPLPRKRGSLQSSTLMTGTIDFREVAHHPTRYRLVCAEHGDLAADVERSEATRTALAHDREQHGLEAEWLYDGTPILESFDVETAPLPATAPTKRRARAAQASLL